MELANPAERRLDSELLEGRHSPRWLGAICLVARKEPGMEYGESFQ